MGIINKMRKQKAVWWRKTGTDAFNQEKYAPPKQIKCRWDIKSQVFYTEDEEEAVSKAVVFVDRSMKPGDILKLGELDTEIKDAPLDNEDVFKIRGFDEINKLKPKASEVLRKAYL